MIAGKLDRRDFLKVAGSGIIGLTCGNLSSTAYAAKDWKRPPNFVFILIDDMGWTDAGCLGSQLYETPNIDKLQGQSIFFREAYMASAVCSPSRASILTGKYPVRFNMHKVFAKNEPVRNQKLIEPPTNPNLPLDTTNIARALKTKDYVTACIGKWHVGEEGPVDLHGANLQRAELWNVRHWYEDKADHGPRAQGFDVAYDKPPEKDPDDYKRINYLTDKSIEFMENNKHRPFFLYLAHHAMHHDYEADPALIEKYRKRIQPGMSQYHALYAANLEHLDKGIGRLMDSIDKLGLAEDTVVIFTSDNGGRTGQVDYIPATNNSPLRQGKHTPYEGGIRVPLFVRWPRVVEPGSATDVPVHSNDFFATMVDIAAVPRVNYDFTDGMSFGPILESNADKSTFENRTLVWFFPCYNEGDLRQGRFTVSMPVVPYSAIRKGEYKLIEWLTDKKEVELYNIRKDIGETTNLAHSMPDKVEKLRTLLGKWYSEYDAPLPKNNPDYDPRFGWVKVEDLKEYNSRK